ncbi:hypothetical protein TNCV_11701 [Trichonephila clavipes]|nr:hypothetical protein TNCV_11701 [Trichonephila clavipes]
MMTHGTIAARVRRCYRRADGLAAHFNLPYPMHLNKGKSFKRSTSAENDLSFGRPVEMFSSYRKLTVCRSV